MIQAVRNGSRPTVELLVARGADVNAIQKNGATALLLVVSRGDFALVKFLLAKGADVNSGKRPQSRYDALMQAAYSDFVEVETVQALLQKGAQIDARAPDGETALSLARKKGETEVVRLLLDAGATQ